MQSLPSQGAWIEIFRIASIFDIATGRSLHRERGLKLILRAEIECDNSGRSLHRERGLKYYLQDYASKCFCRSLHRERGLKYRKIDAAIFIGDVAPFTGSVD